MTVRRRAAVCAAAGGASFALTISLSVPASAHGSMTDPVSRVAACYAEGVESPRSAACKAAVAASGKQAFYDWNAVNIANAAGKSKQIIPDGKLCSAANDKYRGLDLPRADWPSTKMSGGSHTFRYKGTAPHKGSFELYITKTSYDPAKPLKWSDLEAQPFVKVADPKMENGDYVFQGSVPARSGRHLIYSIWQRSDSPEAFYTCSDVVFGKDGKSGGSAVPAPAASAPTEKKIADGAAKSSVQHQGHGTQTGSGASAAPKAAGAAAEPEVKGVDGTTGQAPNTELAETGGNSNTPYIAIAGAAVLSIGATAVITAGRRRARAVGR
ncbi:lytic polysaccharide monooxygenase [Streptomyces sp. NBC_00825]|uniref:lytic polysaccharide monooxygenase n=1 Tax=unclassified Streptomyces TaxID=2593676 RepID=UPI00224E61C9|nr:MULTISPECIES: lytic polysaccharide monooxygenase [unclassified Streptomyces]WTB52327.1 lytic polysaccharide monooxygenase [Streptomyces sp. NBC_00826]WTH94782.1 lytic polysaccharide monooxygenase [Streptomyces sp. NBC_00825]WTI03516.1 lytic polysaccharide monooxygenase [Streptomyces sp. NBC_00822]MCX4869081.1 lytic polysaccharide monooxygenase [Streptomyces sp. NBC_00906]MCX4900319.1 lytic polysaccharide monooxygenase [Streptomyces sp. NBC_00892]